MYSGCKQFPTRKDNRLGEIAQVQLIFCFLYALLLKLDADASNSTGWDNYIYDNLMVLVSFSGVGLALIQPVLGRLLGRCGGQDDVEGIAEYSGSGDMEEVLRETFAAIGERNQGDDDVEMGRSVPEAKPKEAEEQSKLPRQPNEGGMGQSSLASRTQSTPFQLPSSQPNNRGIGQSSLASRTRSTRAPRGRAPSAPPPRGSSSPRP